MFVRIQKHKFVLVASLASRRSLPLSVVWRYDDAAAIRSAFPNTPSRRNLRDHAAPIAKQSAQGFCRRRSGRNAEYHREYIEERVSGGGFRWEWQRTA